MKTYIMNNTVFTIPTGIQINELRSQRGPTCGIYALESILRAYGDVVYATKDRCPTIVSLRFIAKKNTPNPVNLDRPAAEQGKCYSKIGELFYASEIPSLIETIKADLKLNYSKTPEQKSVGSANFLSEMKAAIDGDRLVMVPFSVNPDTGYPGDSTDDNAHWCVVWGYTPNPPNKFLASHWGQMFEFDATALQRSNEQIKPFPESEWGKPIGSRMDDYKKVDKLSKLCRKKVKFSEIPLDRTLANKIIIV